MSMWTHGVAGVSGNAGVNAKVYIPNLVLLDVRDNSCAYSHAVHVVIDIIAY